MAFCCFYLSRLSIFSRLSGLVSIPPSPSSDSARAREGDKPTRVAVIIFLSLSLCWCSVASPESKVVNKRAHILRCCQTRINKSIDSRTTRRSIRLALIPCVCAREGDFVDLPRLIDLFARARRHQIQLLSQQIIIPSPSSDEGEAKTLVCSFEMCNLSKLQLDVLECLLPLTCFLFTERSENLLGSELARTSR